MSYRNRFWEERIKHARNSVLSKRILDTGQFLSMKLVDSSFCRINRTSEIELSQAYVLMQGDNHRSINLFWWPAIQDCHRLRRRWVVQWSFGSSSSMNQDDDSFLLSSSTCSTPFLKIIEVRHKNMGLASRSSIRIYTDSSLTRSIKHGLIFGQRSETPVGCSIRDYVALFGRMLLKCDSLVSTSAELISTMASGWKSGVGDSEILSVDSRPLGGARCPSSSHSPTKWFRLASCLFSHRRVAFIVSYPVIVPLQSKLHLKKLRDRGENDCRQNNQQSRDNGGPVK